MSMKEVKAVVPAARTGLGHDVVGVAKFNYPDTTKGYVDWLGEETTHSLLEDMTQVKIQAVMRSHMVSKDKDGNYSETGKDLQPIVSAYKPGAARERMSPVDKVLKSATEWDDAQTQEFLKKLKERRAAKKG